MRKQRLSLQRQARSQELAVANGLWRTEERTWQVIGTKKLCLLSMIVSYLDRANVLRSFGARDSDYSEAERRAEHHVSEREER